MTMKNNTITDLHEYIEEVGIDQAKLMLYGDQLTYDGLRKLNLRVIERGLTYLIERNKVGIVKRYYEERPSEINLGRFAK